MDEEQQKIKDHFAKNLTAKEYLEIANQDWAESPDMLRFMLVFIHDIFKSEKFTGSKLLEIGSGATVHNVASASAYFPNITMSDYVTDNVESLKHWVAGKSDLKQLLDIPAGLEGYGNDLEAGKTYLENRIRNSIKYVTRCDVLEDPVLLDNNNDPTTSPPFDMIISCLTMEAAPKDYNGYCRALQNASKLLRKGGGFLMCGFLQGTPWVIGKETYNCIKIGEEDVIKALKLAGFENVNLKTEAYGGDTLTKSEFWCEKVFCVVANKL